MAPTTKDLVAGQPYNPIWAVRAGVTFHFNPFEAPRVVLRATEEDALRHCSLADLKRFAIDLD